MTRARWEYKFVRQLGEKQANQLGDEGWELAAISTGYWFKRPKEAKS